MSGSSSADRQSAAVEVSGLVLAGPIGELAKFGVATVYEAAGRRGLIDIPLTRLTSGGAVSGPALPVLCGQDDNLMVHAAIEQIERGDVVVLTMPEPTPVALVGDLLVTQMKLKGAAALLVDASVRDVDDLAKLGLPVWTRFVRVRGAGKERVGTVGEPVTVGGAEVRRGDALLLDSDGAVVVARERVTEVLEKARARLAKENDMRAKFEAGEISYDIHGLRQVVEGGR